MSRKLPERVLLEKEDQWILTEFPNHKILIIGLNSCCVLIICNVARASIMASLALAHSDTSKSTHDSYINCWHHPLDSPDEDRIKDTGFMELLSKSGFQTGIAWSCSDRRESVFSTRSPPEASRINIIAAGTFGAATKELVPAYPWQDNVIKIERNQVHVDTRRREKPHGKLETNMLDGKKMKTVRCGHMNYIESSRNSG